MQGVHIQPRIIILTLGTLIILTLTCFALLSGTVSISLERTPTPDQASIATLASLMLEGTRITKKATEVTMQPATPSSLAIIQGKICYPGIRIPPMRIFFNNIATQNRYDFDTLENQASYSVELPPGKYYAWAWVEQYNLGGFYSQYVACGMGENCTDHRPLLFEVEAGANIPGIDICDWGVPFPTEQIPPP